jgi:hypothetical protein
MPPTPRGTISYGQGERRLGNTGCADIVPVGAAAIAGEDRLQAPVRQPLGAPRAGTASTGAGAGRRSRAVIRLRAHRTSRRRQCSADCRVRVVRSATIRSAQWSSVRHRSPSAAATLRPTCRASDVCRHAVSPNRRIPLGDNEVRIADIGNRTPATRRPGSTDRTPARRSESPNQAETQGHTGGKVARHGNPARVSCDRLTAMRSPSTRSSPPIPPVKRLNLGDIVEPPTIDRPRGEAARRRYVR